MCVCFGSDLSSLEIQGFRFIFLVSRSFLPSFDYPEICVTMPPIDHMKARRAANKPSKKGKNRQFSTPEDIQAQLEEMKLEKKVQEDDDDATSTEEEDDSSDNSGEESTSDDGSSEDDSSEEDSSDDDDDDDSSDEETSDSGNDEKVAAKKRKALMV